MAQIKTAARWIGMYMGDGLHMVLLAAALLYIVFREKDQLLRRLFAGYTCIFALVYFCPPVTALLDKVSGSSSVYWRMLWILPSPVIIAYAMCRVIGGVSEKWKKAVLLPVFAAVICLTGQNVYLQDTPFEKAANIMKIPESPVAICDIVNANREEGERALLGAPEDMVGYIRQYDASIEQVYGRRGGSRQGGALIRSQLAKEKITYWKLCLRARYIHCNFLAVPERKNGRARMAKFGFKEIGQVGSYVIYKDTKAKES